MAVGFVVLIGFLTFFALVGRRGYKLAMAQLDNKIDHIRHQFENLQAQKQQLSTTLEAQQEQEQQLQHMIDQLQEDTQRRVQALHLETQTRTDALIRQKQVQIQEQCTRYQQELQEQLEHYILQKSQGIIQHICEKMMDAKDHEYINLQQLERLSTLLPPRQQNSVQKHTS